MVVIGISRENLPPIRIRIENVKLEIWRFENFIRNFQILLEILNRRKIEFFFSSGSKLPSRGARSRVTDHYHHRPRRFFGFNSGRLFKTYWKIFPVILVVGIGRKEILKINFGTKILGNSLDILKVRDCNGFIGRFYIHVKWLSYGWDKSNSPKFEYIY